MIRFGDVRLNKLSKDLVKRCLGVDKYKIRNRMPAQITMGPFVNLFEHEYAELTGAQYCVAVNSGTSACLAACASLHDILRSNRRNEIIVPALSFVATWNAVIAAGFHPVPVDIDVHTMCIKEEEIEERITDRTCAVLAVNLMGKPANASRIAEICQEHELIYISDSCESHFCKHQGKYIEELAEMCCYSFFAAHIIFSGEMGAVTTNSQYAADLLKSIRSHGRSPDSLYFDHHRFGLNLKPTDIHAAIGIGNLRKSKQIFDKRYDNMKMLRDMLKSIENEVFFIEESPGDTNSPHAFSICLREPNTSRFEALKNSLNYNMIQWKRNFGAISQHRAFLNWVGDQQFTEAQHHGDFGLHVGVHQYLTKKDLQKMAKAIIEGFK